VTLGSGNKLEKIEGRKYSVFYSALVTDANGTPVNDAEVILSIYPSFYAKGTLDMVKQPGEEKEKLTALINATCRNEDLNRNGLLDTEDTNNNGQFDAGEDKNGNNLFDTEDINGNGQLEPGNVVTVDNLTLTTDDTGFANFNVVYAIQFAEWVLVEITARATVAGSEGINRLELQTTCEAGDNLQGLCPLPNPFGVGTCDQPF